jgi:hypothetical protein
MTDWVFINFEEFSQTFVGFVLISAVCLEAASGLNISTGFIVQYTTDSPALKIPFGWKFFRFRAHFEESSIKFVV